MSLNIKTIKKCISNSTVPIINFYDELDDPQSDYAVCVIPANDYAMQLLNISRESIQKYAKKCNADYIELKGDQNPDWPMSNKYRLHKVSSTYEKTLYLDCDIIIKDESPNLFELTPNDKISAYEEYEIFSMPDADHFGWARKDYELIIRTCLKNNSYFMDNGKIRFPDKMINGGVLMIPKSEADYYKQPEYPYPKIWCFDQQLLTVLLERDNKLFTLDKKWNFEFIRQDFWENHDSAYFLHFNAARPDSYRQTVMKRFKANNTERYTYLIDESVKCIQWFNPASKKYFSIFKDVDDNPPDSPVDKNLIITVACGQEYEDMLKITGPIFKRYAEKYNADYIEITGATQEIGYFEKFRIHPFVKQYNRTLFIDSDVIITDDAPNIFDAVPEDYIGIHCDYESVYNDGAGYGHMQTFDNWKLKTAKSFLSQDEMVRYLEISKNKMLNSGVVVCSKKHADIWRGAYKPCLKNSLIEQFIVEMRIFLENYDIFFLDRVWNTQVWMPNNIFFQKNIKKHFIHFSGWRNTNFSHQEIGSIFVGTPIKEMLEKVINGEIYIYS